VNVARTLKRLCVSVFLALVASALTSCGSSFVFKDQGVIPQSLFGMTVLDFENTRAPLQYGTTRTWDSFPTLDWADINSAPGVYDFQHLDNFLKINQERNVEVIYTFGRTPLWASSRPGTPTPYGPGQCAPPGNLQSWDNYVTAIAVHAGTRIQYWELWNEPQDSEYYCGDMRTMVTMAQHAYRIIKSVNPAAEVLTPSASSEGGPAWLATYLSMGGGDYADILSFHGYCDGEAEAINSVVAQYRSVASAHGQGTKPLWDTEANWADDPYDVNEGDTNLAAFIAKYYLLQWSGGVSRFVWYAYDGGSWGGFPNTAGINPDVTAYSTVQQWMEGATMPSACMHDPANTWSCPLTRAGGYKALVLWNPSKTLSYRVPAQYSDVRDLSGNVSSLSGGHVPVGDSPILVETSKAF
jgi:polysaccharide biosynthesis protein PslG